MVSGLENAMTEFVGFAEGFRNCFHKGSIIRDRLTSRTYQKLPKRSRRRRRSVSARSGF